MPGPNSAETDRVLAQLREPSRVILARLHKNTINPLADLIVLGDLVECDFAGYAPVRLTNWTEEEPLDDDYAEVFSDDIVIAAAAGVEPQTIGGWYLTVEGDGNALSLMQTFPLEAPFVIELEGQEIGKRFRIFSNNVAV